MTIKTDGVDPTRIDRMLDKLRRIWAPDPDSKLGRVIVDFRPIDSESVAEIFFARDDDLEREMDKMIKERRIDSHEAPDAREIKDGGSAFASTAVNNLGKVYHQQGMSLRGYFAGQAVAALAGRAMVPSGPITNRDRIDMEASHRDLARAAVSMSDALIEELKK